MAGRELSDHRWQGQGHQQRSNRLGVIPPEQLTLLEPEVRLLVRTLPQEPDVVATIFEDEHEPSNVVPLAPTNAPFATRKTSDRIAGSAEMVSTISSTPTRSFAARRRMAVAAAGSGSISSPAKGAVLGVLIVLSLKSAALRMA